MNKISQLLHKQLWSKRTSWIFFTVFVVGCVLALLWTDWVTPREARAAQEVINRVDKFRASGVSDTSEFEKENAALQELVHEAAKKQVTERDQIVVLLLDGYVSELSYRQGIQNMPDAKIEALKLEGVSDGDARQRRLDWLALEEKQHKQSRTNLERMIGN